MSWLLCEEWLHKIFSKDWPSNQDVDYVPLSHPLPQATSVHTRLAWFWIGLESKKGSTGLFWFKFDPHRKGNVVWDSYNPFTSKLNAPRQVHIISSESTFSHPGGLRQKQKAKQKKTTVLLWAENRSCLSSQTVTWLFVGVKQATIPHLKEDIQGYLLI